MRMKACRVDGVKRVFGSPVRAVGARGKRVRAAARVALAGLQALGCSYSSRSADGK